MSDLRDELRHCANTVLAAWQEHFGPTRGDGRYQIDVAGPDLMLEVRGPSGVRPVRGRLSAPGLLAGRFWAAASLEPEAWRLCPAWIPTLIENEEGMGAVLGRDEVRHALMRAAEAFEEAGEEEEGAACRVRAERAVPALPGRGLEKTLAGLKQGDAPARLRAVRSCEATFDSLVQPVALVAYGPFRAALRVLLAEPLPALLERGLALAEAWARQLHRDGAYREALPLLDTLVDASVALGDSLRMRYEARLATGDVPGARNDFTRLAHARTAAASADVRQLTPLAPWQIGVLERVARAHLLWAAGLDPCRGRAPSRPPASITALRHAVAARDATETALSLLATNEGAGDAVALRRLRDEVITRAEELRGRRPARGRPGPASS